MKGKENITNKISLSHRPKKPICAFAIKEKCLAQNGFLFLKKNLMSLKLSE